MVYNMYSVFSGERSSGSNSHSLYRWFDQIATALMARPLYIWYTLNG
jgi:hypothetical protein